MKYDRYYVVDLETAELHEMSEKGVAMLHENTVQNPKTGQYEDLYWIQELEPDCFELQKNIRGVYTPLDWFDTYEEASEEVYRLLYHEIRYNDNEFFVTENFELAVEVLNRAKEEKGVTE